MSSIIKYDEMTRAISECHSIDEVKDIRDKAIALEVYARQAKNREAEFKCAEIRLRAERQWGLLYTPDKKAKGGNPEKIKPNPFPDEAPLKTLTEMGVSRKQSHQWQSLAQIDEDKFESALGAFDAMEQRPTADKLRAFVSNNSGNSEWMTPPEIVDAAKKVMGGIDLDPASSFEANAVIEAAEYFDEERDGLNQEWWGRVWMNPPFNSALLAQFVEKLVNDFKDGFIEEAIVLTNNITETKSGQLLLSVADATCFPSGRLRFLTHEGEAMGAPLQGQMVNYFGRDPERFISEFSSFGSCLSRFKASS